MTTPVPPIPGSMPAPSTAAQVTVTVLGGDGVAAKLAAAGAFEATVLRITGRSTVLAATPAGKLALRLPFPLAEGSRIALQPVANPSSPQLRILSVNGRPPAAATTPTPPAPPAPPSSGGGTRTTATPPAIQPSAGQASTPRTATPRPSAGASGSAQTAATPSPSQPSGGQRPSAPLTATLLRAPGSSSGGAAPALQGPAPGVTLTLRLLAIDVPTGGATASPTGAPNPPMPAASLPSAAPAPLTATQTPPTAPTSPTILIGTVAPNTHAGQPLIQTPIGLLALANAPALPPGAAVTLELGAVLPPPQPTPPPPLQPTVPGGQWPALSEAVQVLQRADPGAAEVLARILPQPDSRLAATGTMFAAAIRAGDARAWLGDALGAMERMGRKDLAKRLTDDVADLAGRMRQPAGDWRAFPLPLLNGDTVEPVRVVVRQPRRDDDQQRERGGGDDGIRFLVDLDLSRLGPLQLDGLVRRENKRFDLAVRTHDPLPEEVRAEIAGIFAKALDGLGMTGAALFQVTQRFVEVTPDEDEGRRRGVLV